MILAAGVGAGLYAEVEKMTPSTHVHVKWAVFQKFFLRVPLKPLDQLWIFEPFPLQAIAIII